MGAQNPHVTFTSEDADVWWAAFGFFAGEGVPIACSTSAADAASQVGGGTRFRPPEAGK